MTSNLPNFPGAATVYERVGRICERLCADAYAAQRAKDARKSLRFSVPDDVSALIDAMDRGDEEVLKGAIASHLNIVFGQQVPA